MGAGGGNFIVVVFALEGFTEGLEAHERYLSCRAEFQALQSPSQGV
jgi:hypothetical protein